MALTLLPRHDDLEGVNHLGVEARRQLDTHACREQHEVEVEQIRLLVPSLGVLGGEPGDDGVGLADLGGGSKRHLDRVSGWTGGGGGLVLWFDGLDSCSGSGGTQNGEKRVRDKGFQAGGEEGINSQI